MNQTLLLTIGEDDEMYARLADKSEWFEISQHSIMNYEYHGFDVIMVPTSQMIEENKLRVELSLNIKVDEDCPF